MKHRSGIGCVYLVVGYDPAGFPAWGCLLKSRSCNRHLSGNDGLGITAQKAEKHSEVERLFWKRLDYGQLLLIFASGIVVRFSDLLETGYS
jgi:hypothetical protein